MFIITISIKANTFKMNGYGNVTIQTNQSQYRLPRVKHYPFIFQWLFMYIVLKVNQVCGF